jgi:hypothetical protein
MDADYGRNRWSSVRDWPPTPSLRGKPLKRLIAFAPATFGSPLAKKGRSWHRKPRPNP